ncbi:mRNA-capping enzyme subunit beta [Podila humilis]|nr:mRNA-capping enzyme subunit beta [Podila humilis]
MSESDSSRKRQLEDTSPEAYHLHTNELSTKKARSEQEKVVVSEKNGAGAGEAAASAPPANSAQTTIQPQQQNQQQPPSRPQQPSAQQQNPGTQPRRDHAFFGTDVMDDVVRTVGEFLFQHCHHANVEIEAKLGILTDNNTGRRIELPVMSETVLVPQRPAWYRFVSDMTIDQHAHFNNVLNKRLGETRHKDFKGYQIQYKHTKEIDQFYPSSHGKTRVTKDQSTNTVVENGIVKKDRIADLDVFSPRSPFDFRISVNVENPVPAPSGTPQFERQKDRITYRHHNFQIDLTQVKTGNSNNNNNNNSNQQRPNYSQMARPPQVPEVTHELEIEFVHPEELVRERNIRLNNGQGQGQRPDRFWEIVGYFINNVRGLATIKYLSPAQRQQQQQQQQQRR